MSGRFRLSGERSVGVRGTCSRFPYEESLRSGLSSNMTRHVCKVCGADGSSQPRIPSADGEYRPHPGPEYLEVWVRSLTKIMPEAPDGHQPHELQAGALGVDVFHQGCCLCRGQAVFAFTRDRRPRGSRKPEEHRSLGQGRRLSGKRTSWENLSSRLKW